MAILVKYSSKNYEFIAAFSMCILYVYCVPEPGMLLQICNICMFKQLRCVYTWGGGGGQPPDQLLISYILCDASF